MTHGLLWGYDAQTLMLITRRFSWRNRKLKSSFIDFCVFRAQNISPLYEHVRAGHLRCSRLIALFYFISYLYITGHLFSMREIDSYPVCIFWFCFFASGWGVGVIPTRIIDNMDYQISILMLRSSWFRWLLMNTTSIAKMVEISICIYIGLLKLTIDNDKYTHPIM